MKLTASFLKVLSEEAAAMPVRRLKPKYGRRGSVLVPLLNVDGVGHVLFQRRAANMRNHANQISFPGGIREAGDASGLETALRETEEEIGLPPHRVAVLGRLSQLYSKKGDVITPHVGFIGDYATAAELEAELALSPHEVREVFCLPLGDFQDPLYVEDDVLTHREHVIASKRYTRHPERVIWGLSAMILTDTLALIDRVKKRL